MVIDDQKATKALRPSLDPQLVQRIVVLTAIISLRCQASWGGVALGSAWISTIIVNNTDRTYLTAIFQKPYVRGCSPRNGGQREFNECTLLTLFLLCRRHGALWHGGLPRHGPSPGGQAGGRRLCAPRILDLRASKHLVELLGHAHKRGALGQLLELGRTDIRAT